MTFAKSFYNYVTDQPYEILPVILVADRLLRHLALIQLMFLSLHLIVWLQLLFVWTFFCKCLHVQLFAINVAFVNICKCLRVQLFAINVPINLCRFLLLLALVESSENSVECLQINYNANQLMPSSFLTCRSCPVIELLFLGVPEPLLETLPPPPPSRVSPLKPFF